MTDVTFPTAPATSVLQSTSTVVAHGWNLTVASLKMLLRDREAIVGLILSPILFVLAFRVFDIPIAGLPPGTDYYDFVVPGLLAMGLMQLLMVGIASAIARYREMQILKRIQVTPVSPAAFVAGQVLARLALAIVALALMMGVAVALGANIRGSWWSMMIIASAGNVVFLTLGFAIAGRAKTVDGANNLAGLSTIPLMFLSGMFFPVEVMPDFLQSVVQYLPITPVIDALRAVALEGAGFGDVAGELVILAGWIIGGFAAAAATFRFGDGA